MLYFHIQGMVNTLTSESQSEASPIAKDPSLTELSYNLNILISKMHWLIKKIHCIYSCINMIQASHAKWSCYLIEGVQAELSHRFVHCFDQVQQLSMPRTHFHPQKCPARDNTWESPDSRHTSINAWIWLHFLFSENMSQTESCGDSDSSTVTQMLFSLWHCCHSPLWQRHN